MNIRDILAESEGYGAYSDVELEDLTPVQLSGFKRYLNGQFGDFDDLTPNAQRVLDQLVDLDILMPYTYRLTETGERLAKELGMANKNVSDFFVKRPQETEPRHPQM